MAFVISDMTTLVTVDSLGRYLSVDVTYIINNYRVSKGLTSLVKVDYISVKSEEHDNYMISKGGISGTIVDGKVLFKIALDFSASAIILCHNHPSGQLFPSFQDEKITSELICFGKMIDLPILDHLIFTDNGYFSFAENGLMK